MKIKLYDQPFAVVEPKEFYAKSVAEWLLSYYGETPKVTLQIYKGEPSQENEVSSNVTELLKESQEVCTVLESPGLPAAVAAFLVQVAIAIAISVVMSVLFPPPSMPGNVNRTQQSPNNSLTSRENQVRYGQRVEDIYGTVKSIPSLMMPVYNKYIEHQQVEYAYYCVGRGYYDINELKDGDTLLSEISKSSAKVFKPFTSPNSGTPQQVIGDSFIERIVSVSRPDQVNGITLKAFNQVQLPNSAKYDFKKVSGYNTIAQVDPVQPSFGSIMKVGDTITISMTSFYPFEFSGSITVTALTKTFSSLSETPVFTGLNAGNVIQVSGFTNAANNGTFTIASIVDNTITVTNTLVNEVKSVVITYGPLLNYSGTQSIESVSDNSVKLSSTDWTYNKEKKDANIKITVSSTDLTPITNYTDWVTLNDKSRTQVWVNIIARSGMYSDSGGGKNWYEVGFILEIEKLNLDTFEGTGVIETVSGVIGGSTSDERAITVEHTTDWVGPCRVRMKRTTDYDYSFKGTIIDEIKWNDVYSVTPVNTVHFGNKTTIQVVSKATARATSIKQRQLNCIASRKLPIYNGTSFSGTFDPNGTIATGTISATSKLVDILHAVCTDPVIGNDITQLDLNQVWSVQQKLDNWSLEAGQFNYTFDSDSTSFEETVSIIANAGFCIAYRQNGKIRLSFDKLQSNSTALFTHRNKKPDAETITRRFTTDVDYDGVEFVYTDPKSNQSETIKLPLGGLSVKYKKFEIPGIRSFTQAWYRASREYQKLKGQRLSIETTCTTDARLLLPNTRVDIVDNTRFKAYDGEVIKQSGLVLTLSRDVLFTVGNHSILLMKRNGTVDSIQCTAGVLPNQVVLSRAPAEAIVTNGGAEGIRTIFSLASDSDRLSQAWLVQEIGISDEQYVTIKAINYSKDYYYYDTQPVPNSSTIINE